MKSVAGSSPFRDSEFRCYMKSMFETIEALDFMQRRMRAIDGEKGFLECERRNGRSVEGCWCYRSGPDGTTLPCPPESKETTT